jgi:6-phosphofructokinase 2
MAAIVTLTLNPAVDKNTRIEHVGPEKKLRCEKPEFHPGGGGLNVARAIAKLGGSALALWTCGGHTGRLLADLIDAEQIEHIPIEIAEPTRENLIVYEERSGQQFRFGMPGARLSEAEMQQCLDFVRGLDPPPEYLVVSGSLPPGVPNDFCASLAEAAPDQTRVILDTSGAALHEGAEHGLFLVKPNIVELAHFVGREIEDECQLVDAARQLIATGGTHAVVTSLGAGGAVLVTADSHFRVHAPTVRIRSKVGAGDSMVAGIVLALQRGESLETAVTFGVAAGSAAVMTEGTELCRRDDTERLFNLMTAS